MYRLIFNALLGGAMQVLSALAEDRVVIPARNKSSPIAGPGQAG